MSVPWLFIYDTTILIEMIQPERTKQYLFLSFGNARAREFVRFSQINELTVFSDTFFATPMNDKVLGYFKSV